MLFKDPQLKIERGYKDPDSYVRNDGTEVLYGEDWENRKNELWARSGFRCEVNETGKRCQREAVDPHHKVRRHIYRDDRLEALEAICEVHHKKFHPEKQLRWRKDEANVTR